MRRRVHHRARYDGRSERANHQQQRAMQLIEKAFAAIVLLACLLFLVRMLIGPRRRAGLDAWLRDWQPPWRRNLRAAWRRSAAARAQSRAQSQAHRAADDVIERARRSAAGGEWEGNVYRPKSFKRKKRDLH